MKLPRMHLIIANILIAGMVGSFASSVLAIDDRTDLVEFDTKKFSRPSIVDNKWMPQKPGMQLVYERSTVEDGKRVAHQVIDIVTDLVKVVNGIETVIVWERDFVDGKLEESALAFRAQDDTGNVWLLGEVKEVYDENVKLIGARMWTTGRLGVLAGIIMPGKPAEGTPSYSQGLARGAYAWNTRGQVRKVGEEVTVPAGTFKDVIVTEEWSKGERAAAALQLKYYAPGIGYIKLGWEGKDPVKETLELAKVLQLNAQEIDKARAEALLVEERAYYYGRTTDPPRRRQR